MICDRFADSTRIYQGVLGEVDLRLIRALERVSIGDLKPDLTLVLDVPAEMGMKRAAGRRRGGTADRFEAEDIDFHKKLRQAYLALATSRERSLRHHRCQRAEEDGRAAHVAGCAGEVQAGQRRLLNSRTWPHECAALLTPTKRRRHA